MRDEYVGLMESAGFHEVTITDEMSVKWVAGDSTANAWAESLKIPYEEIEEVASSVVIIKRCGIKPKDGA